MQYELAQNRGILLSDSEPSMKLLYLYSKYRKEREKAKVSVPSQTR